MSNAESVRPAAKRRSFRYGLPAAVVALAWAAVAGFWALEEGGWLSRDFKILSLVGAILLTVLTFFAWLIFFSGLRWWQSLGVAAAAALLAVASVKEVRPSGDMLPLVRFRWQKSPEQVLEEHRRGHAAAETRPGEVSLQGTHDFPAYRGVHRDGVVDGPPLARDWNARPPKVLWRQPVGRGNSAFAVVGDVILTQEQRGPDEAVVCYDAATGRERWATPFAPAFYDVQGGPGPRATPTVADGAVFAMGAKGTLVCLDAVTGEKKWSVDTLANNANIAWGMSASPLVYGAVVVAAPGVQVEGHGNNTLVAYDRVTGKRLWGAGTTKTGYSSPMLATLAGRRQILLFDGKGLSGYDAEDGKQLWWTPWQTNQDINVGQPVFLDGDRVFIASGYGVGGGMYRVTEAAGDWKVESLWKTKALRCKFTSPVAYQGHLYGLDDGTLVCLDAESGERQWRGERFGHGQLLRSGDLLVILGEFGELALVEATPEGYHELGRIQALEGRSWNNPALANGKIYLRNDQEMACYDLTAGSK